MLTMWHISHNSFHVKHPFEVSSSSLPLLHFKGNKYEFRAIKPYNTASKEYKDLYLHHSRLSLCKYVTSVILCGLVHDYSLPGLEYSMLHYNNMACLVSW